MSCRKSGADGGLWVETRSGVHHDPSLAVCKLGNRQDVYHVVDIHNLHTYPLDTVVCRGDISQSKQRNIQFSSKRGIGTVSHWQDAILSFPAMGKKTLSRVQLLGLQTGSGNDSVSVEVEGTAYLWGKEKVSLTIVVWV